MQWSGAGGTGSCVGSCFDASTYGLLMVVPVSIPRGSQVTVQIQEHDVSVAAIVRHCRKHGAWYRIGLELTTMLQPRTNVDVASDTGV